MAKGDSSKPKAPSAPRGAARRSKAAAEPVEAGRPRSAAAKAAKPAVKQAPAHAAPAKASAAKAAGASARPRPAKSRTAAKSPAAPSAAAAATPPARPHLVAIEGGAAQRQAAAQSPAPAAAAGAGDHGSDDPFRFRAMDVERLSSNVARMIELGGKAFAAYMKPRETGSHPSEQPEGLADIVKTLGLVAEFWLKDPQRAMTIQSEFTSRYMELWAASLKMMGGEKAEPVVKPDARDNRFKDRQWSDNAFFDFLKQFYLVTTGLAERFVERADLDGHTKHKAGFYMRQIVNALSPSNFVPTNPELLRETIGSSGENLVRGMQLLAEDIERGGGDLKIRQSDDSPFALGKNLAVTPGKVIYENDLMQLIQYSPTTEKVGAVPLLIIPPWINKFYILDLVQDKSFIKWAVDQGLTVFVVSWVNPDQRHARKSFADYMHEGPIAALKVVGEVTGQKRSHVIGYCVGGTLLAVTLGYMAAKGIDLVETATFFTTQVDFTHAGDLKVFVDEDQIQTLEKRMAQTGYLEGSQMANAFNMLRSNDLIWSYVVNNYMKGKTPMPFDLLYWNADSPRMPAANHSFYLRHCYLNNDLSSGRMEVDGEKLDLKKVKVPVYNLAAREDHIAPARSVFLGSSAFGGPVEYVMAGSGHIAGVVNPPAKGKYQHWTGGPPVGDFDAWVAKATEHPGSWWPHWREWIRRHDGKEVAARAIGNKKHRPIEDAPGRYVKVKY
ncbi:Poly-beta-hydroxybutyrate polymerase [bacterium YEK0313]|nr:Poly-beta-hydroxybutyrate polymerase [bacterium YEK0313]